LRNSIHHIVFFHHFAFIPEDFLIDGQPPFHNLPGLRIKSVIQQAVHSHPMKGCPPIGGVPLLSGDTQGRDQPPGFQEVFHKAIPYLPGLILACQSKVKRIDPCQGQFTTPAIAHKVEILVESSLAVPEHIIDHLFPGFSPIAQHLCRLLISIRCIPVSKASLHEIHQAVQIHRDEA